MEILQNLMLKNTNPMLANVIDMARKGDSKGVEEFARNVCKDRGIDFDTEFEKFKSGFLQKTNK